MGATLKTALGVSDIGWLENGQMVRQFHEAMGLPLDQPWKPFTSLEKLRLRLINEEFDEVLDAKSKTEMLKELADLVYVAYGYAVTYGWDLDEAFLRVHSSNMSKLHNGIPQYRDDGKVLKGPNYQPPNLEDLV